MPDIVYWSGGEFLAPKPVLSVAILPITETRIVYRYHYSVTFESNWVAGSFGSASRWATQVKSVYLDRKVEKLFARVSTNNVDPYAGSYNIWLYPPHPPVFITDSSESPYCLYNNRFHAYAWLKSSDGEPFGMANFGCPSGRTAAVDGWVLAHFGSDVPSARSPIFSGGRIISIGPICGNTTQYELTPTGDCAIAITYTDNTTFQIPFSTCPEWARVRKDDECPEGTCRVECADHICCYDYSGKAVKIIPK